MKHLFPVFFLAWILVLTLSARAQTHTPLRASLSSNIQGNNFVHEGYRFDISQVLNNEHLDDILTQLE